MTSDDAFFGLRFGPIGEAVRAALCEIDGAEPRSLVTDEKSAAVVVGVTAGLCVFQFAVLVEASKVRGDWLLVWTVEFLGTDGSRLCLGRALTPRAYRWELGAGGFKGPSWARQSRDEFGIVGAIAATCSDFAHDLDQVESTERASVCRERLAAWAVQAWGGESTMIACSTSHWLAIVEKCAGYRDGR